MTWTLTFHGVDDYVGMSVPAPFQNLAGSDFTVLTWVRPGNTVGFQRIPFAQQNSTHFVSLAITTGNTLFAHVVATQPTNPLRYCSVTASRPGRAMP